MAAEIEKHYADVLAGMGLTDRDFEFLLAQYRELKTQTLLDYLDFENFPKTEKQVRGELARQAEEYIKFGLHKHPSVKMGEGRFKDSLVKLAQNQPENFAGRVDIPLAVLGQIPPKDVFCTAGVDYLLEGLGVRDWPEDPYGYRTPQGLYLAWTDTGVRNLYAKVDDVRTNLVADMRGATEADGGGLYVAHPRILTHHHVDFPGSSVESDYAPYLSLFDGRPRVSGSWVDGANPGWGSALCGRD